MGWARTFLLGDIGNRLDIADAERNLALLRRSIRSKARVDAAQTNQLIGLKQENDQLKVILATLIRLLVGKGILSQQELESFAAIIDGDESEQEPPA